MENLYEELQWRGVLYAATEGTQEVLASKKVVGYIGFDPSAASLHVGSLLPIMTLVHMQRHGHTPIAVLGGGTGLIGDPSGKTQERPLLGKDQIEENIHGIRKQLSKFLDFDAKNNPAILVNNADWLASISMLDFLRDIGKYFTVNYMLAKESVESRLEGGMSFTEFNYMLLQAYDFLTLYKRYRCVLQMGGSDQWGNITSGIDLIRRLVRGKAYGLVTPLLQTSSGLKFGKTGSGTVWLDPNLSSPYHFYQFWLNTGDKEVISYLKYFTLLSEAEIEGIAGTLARSPEKREAQKILASDITRMVHGEEELAKAERATAALFGREIEGLSAKDVLDIFSDTPSTNLSAAQFDEEGILLSNLVQECGLVSSRGEARRLIKEGGLYVNNRRVTDEYYKLSLDESIDRQFFVLRKGAKKYHLLRVVPE
jgi:tyrosyl-tRNA synthetase